MHGGAEGSGGQPGNQNAMKNGQYAARARGCDFIISAYMYMGDGDRRRARRKVRTDLEARHAVAFLASTTDEETARTIATSLGVDFPPFPAPDANCDGR